MKTGLKKFWVVLPVAGFVWVTGLIAGEAPMACSMSSRAAMFTKAEGEAVLSSWNEGAAKASVIDFVKRVTTEGGAEFLPEEERVAVFDNDGTLWSEQPLYFQFLFAIERVKELLPQHPEWAGKAPFSDVAKGDLKAVFAGGEKALGEIAVAAQAGVSVEEFQRAAAEWLKTAKHPKLGKVYEQCVFQPMLEMMDYLRENGFQVWIVSGGDAEFVRSFSEKVYGVPPERVVGSVAKTEYKVVNGRGEVVGLPGIERINDGAGKPVGIVEQIGRRPVLAFGNSDGDFEMLEYTTLGTKGARLGLIVHHDDAVREFAYDRDSHVGKLSRGLDEAGKRGWVLVSVKKDWKRVFPEVEE